MARKRALVRLPRATPSNCGNTLKLCTPSASRKARVARLTTSGTVTAAEMYNGQSAAKSYGRKPTDAVHRLNGGGRRQTPHKI